MGRVRVGAYNSSSGVDTWSLLFAHHEFWLRVKYDGTNVYYYYSIDGYYWTKLFQETLAAFFGTAPDRVGFGVNCNHAGNDYLEPMIECVSWVNEVV